MLASFTLALAMSLMPPPASVSAGTILVGSFPEMLIRKGQTLHEWPFSLDEGTLTCIAYAGQRYVFFSEVLPEEEEGTFGDTELPRMVVVTANPFSYFATYDSRELYLPWDSLETLIRRLAPYERMGWKLCDSTGSAPQSDEL